MTARAVPVNAPLRFPTHLLVARLAVPRLARARLAFVAAPDQRGLLLAVAETELVVFEATDFVAQTPGLFEFEIGSGVGALLSLIAEEAGADATIVGVEPHSGHAKFARESKGLDVRNGLLDDIAPNLEKGSFDLVVMNHVLEHTTSPTDTLLTIKSLLKSGGTFVVEVPNVEAPGSRISHFFHAAHHYAFSPATFERLARKTEFAVIEIAALDGDLRGTRLNAILEKPADDKSDSTGAGADDLPKDDPAVRAEALRGYSRWYWLTAASFRKKITHWKRQRAV